MNRALEKLKAGVPVLLVSILSSDGSSPRGRGAMMLCDSDGLLCGSVGGGALEARCLELAAADLAEGASCVREFTLGSASAELPQMLCGGKVTLAFTCLSEDPARWTAQLEQACKALEAGQDAQLDLGEEAGLLTIPALPRVCVFGGGHCAFALVPILARTGFRVAVIDDRRAYADAARFPGAEEVLCEDYGTAAVKLPIDAKDYIVVMTSGHEHDFEVLEQVLHKDFDYLGCMGSRAKAAALRTKLLAAGFSDADVDRVKTPIGLSIGSETPEEIAVSIAAELIAVRAAKRKEAGL